MWIFNDKEYNWEVEGAEPICECKPIWLLNIGHFPDCKWMKSREKTISTVKEEGEHNDESV